ncbi:MAG: tetratricopeptide repeat protein [Chthoniobacterales bacterium]
MTFGRTASLVSLLFLLGFTVGAVARGPGLEPSLYRGKPKPEAGKALLDLARTQAGKGSWENIGVGRVLYLTGAKAEGQQIFDAAVAKKTDASDLIRIGRVYYDAKEYGRAFAAFERALQLKPKDAPWLSEVGAYYNLQGNRAKAEELFDRAFALEAGEVWQTANVAGSYLGLEPLR